MREKRVNLHLSFQHDGIDFEFTAELKPGEPYAFCVGEKILAQRLFEEIWRSRRKSGIDVLAIGDRTMFLPRKTLSKNIYLSLRLRHSREEASARTKDLLDMYGLDEFANDRVKTLSDEKLLALALARSHFRVPGLVVINRCGGYLSHEDDFDLSRYGNAFIVEIT